MQGIYKITNKLNNKIYIGQASNLQERISQHKQKRFVPIDMWINMVGVENFDFEILEESNSNIDLDEREQYYIKLYNSQDYGYNKQEGGFNNSIGEGNGRAKLTYEDVLIIRAAYNNHKNQKETYELFKNKITFNSFQSVWQGRSWTHVMPEVFTEENKKYYTSEMNRKRALLTPEEVLEYRKYYIRHTAKETFDYMISQKGAIMKESSFRKILSGDIKKNSLYKDVPIYKKVLNSWFLNNEPVSTSLESET
jgi:group I intron endonuclease